MQEKIKQVREYQKPAASAKKKSTVKKPNTKKAQKETKTKK